MFLLRSKMTTQTKAGSSLYYYIPHLIKQWRTWVIIRIVPYKYCSYCKKKRLWVFLLLFVCLCFLRKLKVLTKILNKFFTHLLYFRGPVKPIASIILVKGPTFSSVCKESFAERCCKTERLPQTSVSAIGSILVWQPRSLTENFRFSVYFLCSTKQIHTRFYLQNSVLSFLLDILLYINASITCLFQ